jgi:hypothetical protein
VDTNRVTQRDPDDTLDAHYSGLERLYRPHGCIDGVVYIGHMTEDEHGEEGHGPYVPMDTAEE